MDCIDTNFTVLIISSYSLLTFVKASVEDPKTPLTGCNFKYLLREALVLHRLFSQHLLAGVILRRTYWLLMS